MTAENIAIIGAIATILAGFGGAILGSIITYRTGIKLIKRQEFNNAATQFKKIFFNTINFLKTGADIGDKKITTSNTREYLITRKFDYLEAIYNFKIFLNESEGSALEKAWDEYCYPDGIPTDSEIKETFLFMGYYTIEESQGKEKAREKALEKLNKILRFAKFK